MTGAHLHRHDGGGHASAEGGNTSAERTDKLAQDLEQAMRKTEKSLQQVTKNIAASEAGRVNVQSEESRRSLPVTSESRRHIVQEETIPEPWPFLSFVERKPFQLIIAAVLVCNLILLAVETDNPLWPCWNLVNGTFLLLYSAELAARLLHRGPVWRFKTSHWIVYDLVVVIVGIIDFLASSLAVQPDTSVAVPGVVAARQLSVVARGPRFFMLSRLLRVPRIFPMHDPLNSFVKMLLGMMPTFTWILLMIIMMCFTLAIVLTRLVGHGLVVKHDDADLVDAVTSQWANIPTSLFTLFRLTTADDWSKMAIPIIFLNPGWRVFFVCFITFMSWTMLSLLTAVASESLIANTTSNSAEEALRQEVKRQEFAAWLCNEFILADKNQNGNLDQEEWTTMMTKTSVREEMQSHGIHLDPRDLQHIWDMFDVDESGHLSIDEIGKGFSYLQEDLGTKHVANVGHEMRRFGIRIDAVMEATQDGIQSEMPQRDQVLQRVHEGRIKYQTQWAEFLERQQSVDSKAPTKKGTGGGAAAGGGTGGASSFLPKMMTQRSGSGLSGR